jgi:hypothetical protein
MAGVRISFSPLVGAPDPLGTMAEQVGSRFDFAQVAADQLRHQHEPPLPDETLRYGRAFLQLLGGSLPVPQVSRDDTDLSFEWVGPGARMVSVRIGPDGVMRYGGRLGARRRFSGVDPIEGGLPPLLLQAIEQVVG